MTTIQASKDNNCPLLIELHQSGANLHFACITSAIKNNNPAMLTYLLENNCPECFDATLLATRLGHLHLLKILKRFNTVWHPDTLEEAIKHNQIECFKYAFHNGSPYEEDSLMEDVIDEGRIELIEFLLEQDVPLILNSPDLAAFSSKSSVECIKLIVKHGQTVTPAGVIFTIESGKMDKFKYCYQSLTCKRDVQSVWKCSIKCIYTFIKQIDVDDSWWRKHIISPKKGGRYDVDFSAIPELDLFIREKRNLLQEMKEECMETLDRKVEDDVLMYCILPMI